MKNEICNVLPHEEPDMSLDWSQSNYQNQKKIGSSP